MSGLKLAFGDHEVGRKKPLVLGFSGGPDSLALLHALQEDGFQVLAAHLDHGLRPESAAEAEQAAELAAQLGVEFVSERAEVEAYARDNKLSIEEAARRVRYTFLFRVAQEQGAQAVAVAHTADDQVETVLMHWLRGAGTAGMAGMRAHSLPNAWSESIPLVRPLLGTWRSEVEAYYADHGLTVILDYSNSDPRYTRNKIRHELLPLLAAYNPNIRKTIWQNTEVLAANLALLNELTAHAWARCMAETGGDWVVLKRRDFSQEPLAIQRLLLRHAFALLRKQGEQLDYAGVERALAWISEPSAPSRVDWLAGLSLRVDEESVAIEDWRFMAQVKGPQIELDLEVHIEVPGEYSLGDAWELRVVRDNPPVDVFEHNPDPFQAWLDAEKAGDLLILRARRPGDRFQPLGMGSSTRLSDFMVNNKLPERERAGWPLLCKGADILWVPGYRIADPFRLAPESPEALHLQLIRSQS